MSTDESKNRMTPRLWAQAESLYESGEHTLDSLAEKFGIHVATVQRHMKKNNIQRGSKVEEIKRRVEEKLADTTAEDIELKTRRARETKEEHYRINQAIDKRIARELIQAEQKGASIASSFPTFKALKVAAEVLKMTREGRYAVLGLNAEDDNDDELPSLEVREMLDEEIAKIRDAQSAQALQMGLAED